MTTQSILALQPNQGLGELGTNTDCREEVEGHSDSTDGNPEILRLQLWVSSLKVDRIGENAWE